MSTEPGAAQITDGQTTATERLPSHLSQINWPKNVATDEIGRLVLRELDDKRARSIVDRLREVSVDVEDFRARLISATKIRPSKSLAHVPHSGPIPSSIGDAFTGRDVELWQLDMALSSTFSTERPQARTLVIEGGPGYGKTRLAAEYASRYAVDRFASGIFWISGDADIQTLRSQQYDILRRLGSPAHPLQWYADGNNGSEIARELVEAIRSVEKPEQILVIIDNYPEPIGSASPIPVININPLLNLSTTLITSRLRVGSGLKQPVVSLGVLDLDSARLLLRHGLSGQSLSHVEWNIIAKWVGSLPLALSLLNALLVSRASNPKELLSLALANRHTTGILDEGAAVLAGTVPVESVAGVTATLHLAITKLPAPAQTAAVHFAQLAPNVVPMAVLDQLPTLFTADVRATLVNRSLVDPSISDDGFGTMHRVISDFLRSRTKNIWAVRERMELAVSREAHGALRANKYSEIIALVPHILDLWRSAIDSNETSAEGTVVRLSTLLVAFYNRYDAPIRGVEVAERIRSYVTRVPNVRQEVIDQSMVLITAASATSGSYETAEKSAESELEAVLRGPVLNRHREMQLRKSLATVFTETRRFEKAIVQWTAVVDYHREVFGENQEDTLSEEIHLLMATKWVAPQKAIDGFKDLQRRVSEFGNDNLHLRLHVHHNFGILLGENGQLVESHAELGAALQIALNNFPNEKFRTAHIKMDLAMCKRMLSSPGDAISIAKEAYEALQELVDPMNSHRLQAGTNLMMMYIEVGDMQAAKAIEDSLARGPYFPSI